MTTKISQKLRGNALLARLDRTIFRFAKILSWASCALAIVVLSAITAYILGTGTPKLTLNMLFGEFSGGNASLLPAFAGTLGLVLVSALIAVPLGIFTAIFLTEYLRGDSKIVRAIRVAAETLAGIPSIVYGLFGYLIFVDAFGWGYSILGGGITLAIMILPTIIRTVEESLRAVPVSFREGALALGTGKVGTIFRVVVPAASGGIITAVVLAIGRVVSESAVLILTIGMVVDKLPRSLFTAGTSLSLDVYYFASTGSPNAAEATAAVLLIFVLGLNLFLAFLGKIINKKYEMKT